MNHWLYQTGVGLLAWSFAGVCALCVSAADLDHWWMWIVAGIPALGFWACLDWYASIKKREA